MDKSYTSAFSTARRGGCVSNHCTVHDRLSVTIPTLEFMYSNCDRCLLVVSYASASEQPVELSYSCTLEAYIRLRVAGQLSYARPLAQTHLFKTSGARGRPLWGNTAPRARRAACDWPSPGCSSLPGAYSC